MKRVIYFCFWTHCSNVHQLHRNIMLILKKRVAKNESEDPISTFLLCWIELVHCVSTVCKYLFVLRLNWFHVFFCLFCSAVAVAIFSFLLLFVLRVCMCEYSHFVCLCTLHWMKWSICVIHVITRMIDRNRYTARWISLFDFVCRWTNGFNFKAFFESEGYA